METHRASPLDNQLSDIEIFSFYRKKVNSSPLQKTQSVNNV